MKSLLFFSARQTLEGECINVESATPAPNKAVPVMMNTQSRKTKTSFDIDAYRTKLPKNQPKTPRRRGGGGGGAVTSVHPHKLPDTTYYCSNHVLVNRERVAHGLGQLQRSRFLDELALSHAKAMAQESRLFHVVDSRAALQQLVQSDSAAQNMVRGRNIRSMHACMMMSDLSKQSIRNILSPSVKEFGMGTAKGADGLLYMVQFFRGDVRVTA